MNINNNVANTTVSIPASTVTIPRAPVLRLRAHVVDDSEAGSSLMCVNMGNSSRSVKKSNDGGSFSPRKRTGENISSQTSDSKIAKLSSPTSTFGHNNEISTADCFRNAICSNNINVVKKLIANHGIQNDIDENGNTPLHILADIDNDKIDDDIINELISACPKTLIP